MKFIQLIPTKTAHPAGQTLMPKSRRMITWTRGKAVPVPEQDVELLLKHGHWKRADEGDPATLANHAQDPADLKTRGK